jgi:EAL domain-containing protein (putative c-di-GMP-specific phosphodiesterase class I)
VDRSNRTIAALSGLYEVGGMALDVSVTGGLAPGDPAASGVLLLRRADVAMYLAKSDRKPLEVYAADRDTANPARLAMAGRLRAAIELEELTLHFQPQVDLTSGRVVGVESLVRWTPAGADRPVSPVEFIAVAERTGLIHPLTRLVLRRAVDQAQDWVRQGHDLRVSTNLSARNLEDPTLVPFLADLLAERGLDPSRLEVEVTETSVMIDPDAAIDTLERIHALGVAISIDDFGTGHSSLAYLTRLPVDQLKVDRSFVLELTKPGSGAAVVHAIVDLSRHLGLEVVAEGVETAAHVQLLTEMGCDVGQGYFFARPLPAGEVAAWIEAREAPLPAPVVVPLRA